MEKKRPDTKDPMKREVTRQPDEPEAPRKAGQEDIDQREEEGWDQPESSAQKGPNVPQP